MRPMGARMVRLYDEQLEHLERLELFEPDYPPSSTVFRARLVENPLSPADVEHAADAKARHRARDLRRAAAVLFNPFDHLLDKICRKHAVAAHGRKLEHGGVGQFVHAPAKAQGIFHAVAGDAGLTAGGPPPPPRRPDVS